MAKGVPFRSKAGGSIESLSRAPSFWRTGRPSTLLSAFLYAETSFLVWILLGPLAVFIAADLHVTAKSLTGLLALPILAGTVLHLPAGLLADRFGARRVGLVAHLGMLAAFGGSRGPEGYNRHGSLSPGPAAGDRGGWRLPSPCRSRGAGIRPNTRARPWG